MIKRFCDYCGKEMHENIIINRKVKSVKKNGKVIAVDVKVGNNWGEMKNAGLKPGVKSALSQY